MRDEGPETYGGELAKSAAELQLTGSSTVTMTTEPGVDKDRNGRLVRYVQADDDPPRSGVTSTGLAGGVRVCT